MSEKIAVPGLSHGEQDTLDRLVAQWRAKLKRNTLRASYYDGKNAVRDLGISVPPAMNRVATVLGWSAKAVDVLNRRCSLEGFRYANGNAADLGVEHVWEQNQLALEAPQAQVSSLIHAVSWQIVTRGDEQSGEPKALITMKDAIGGTGLWDSRRRSLSAFMSIVSTDKNGEPTGIDLYLPNLVVYLRKGDGWRVVGRRAHEMGVPVEPLVYQPRLGRPLGSSRISRPVMSIHDMAIRTVIRSEVSAELYSVPQRVLLGADESAFVDANGNMKTSWQAIFGRIWAIGRDEDGEVPEMKEFAAAPQTPHMEQLRSLAALFAGETSIPLSSLGISGDANPTSAEAYEAGRADLVSEAEGAIASWGTAWKRTMLRALQIENDWQAIPGEVAVGLSSKWRNPAYVSKSAAADAASKMLSQLPWLAETDLALEMFGMDSEWVQRAQRERQKAQAHDRLRMLTDAVRARNGNSTASGAVQDEPEYAGGSGV